MRKTLVLLVLSVVLLAACADTPAPTEPAVTTAPTARPSTPLPTPPTGVDPTDTPLPPATDAAWPAFLRELEFSIPAGNSYGPRDLAIHPGLGRVYVRTQSQGPDAPGQVTVMDSATGRVLARVETGLDAYADGELAVDAIRDRVYALNADEGTISVFDAQSLEPLDTIQAADRLALDAEGGQLYVAGLTGLRVLAVADYAILRETAVSYSPHFLDVAVAPTRERITLLYEEQGDYFLAQYDAATLQELSEVALPGRPESLAPDPARGLVYLSLSDGEQNLLWTLDEQGRLVEERILGDWTSTTHLALDPQGNRLFMAREAYGDYGIAVLDLASGEVVGDIALELAPYQLLWDGDGGRLWVSHTYEHKVGVVDVDAGTQTALFSTALDLVDLAVDPDHGLVYVTDTAGQLHVLDGETNEEVALLPGEGRIAVDGPHGRLYTGGSGASGSGGGRVRIFDTGALEQIGQINTKASPVADAHSGQLYLVQNGIYLASLETMTITMAISDTLPEAPGYSYNPSAVDAVVDPGSGRIFAIISNGVPGSNAGTYLYVYEPGTYRRVFTDTERSPAYVDVDPTTGNAYISRIHLAGASTSLLEDGREYTARLDAVFGALRVDPGLAKVYLSVDGEEAGELLVLDAENLDVLGSVQIPSGLSLRALDPERHLLYLASRDGRVQIWSATGGNRAPPARTVPARPEAGQILQLFLGPGDTPIFTGSLYQSDDEGRAWQRIDAGLPQRGVQTIAVSPQFAQDGTLFAALMATNEGLGIWKSTNGGRSWQIASRGLTDLAVTDLAISPDFGADGTLFATTRRQGLFRSTDGGGTWQRLTGRYQLAEDYPPPPGGVFLSPTYGRDKTVFVIHSELYRSTDGGESWTRSFADMSAVALSPGFATDRTAFGWSGSGGVLRTSDGGDTWQPANAGLALSGYGSGRILVSPDLTETQTLYLVWSPATPEVPQQVFRSTDGAATWEILADASLQAATPVELSADGSAFLALDESARLVRWEIEALPWQAASLPPIGEIEIDTLLLSPAFTQDRTLYATSQGAGILRSGDAGLTWADTGFPLRPTSFAPLEPVAVPPDGLFVGTSTGLFRYGDEGWGLVGGGLPAGASVLRVELGADDSLRVLVEEPGEGQQRVFLSTDGGQSWTEPVPPLPQRIAAEDLRLSPAFAADRTAILSPGWEQPWRTVAGGPWERMGPPGDWTVSALQLAPTFDRDGLIFLRLDDTTLQRSTDGGDTWTPIDGPWGSEAPVGVAPGTGYTVDALTFSPAFAQDGVILTQAGTGLYRSTDRGQTWTEVSELSPLAVQVAFAPDYAQSGELYLLQGDTLYCSTDRGNDWQALPAAPWDEADEVHLLLSPTLAEDETLLAWTLQGNVYQSADGAKTWRDVSGGLPARAIRQVVFSPDYAADGLIYLVPHGPGLYKREHGSPWLPAADRVPTPGPTAAPATQPPPTAAPPVSCELEPVRFAEVWRQQQASLGCPEQPAQQVTLAEQALEHGRMLWDSSTLQIYVLMDSGTWQAFDDTFQEGIDPPYDPNLPSPPQQPQRGFGKVWRDQLGGPEATIGWALENERPVLGWRQRFDGGLLIWTDAVLAENEDQGTAYLLYDNGTWQAEPAVPQQ
ncbi:MAG: hypothetical protein ACK2U2_04355 [Anaerolineae bacterium]